MLWHNGYDVWLGNSRGNRYSKNHTSLSPKNETFWDFSFHEMGIYDLPATIDYILFTTGFTQLHYIGHSQGTTIFFVMCAKQPNYNDKIILMQAMAPAVYVSHFKSPLIPFLNFYLTKVMKEYKGEMFPNQYLKRSPCFKKNDVIFLCMELFYWLSGHNPEQFNTTLAPIIFSHTPAGASVKSFRHFAQLKDSEKFLEYDYGQNENFKRYGTDQPPKYNLEDITAPIILHFGANDYLVNPVDVNQLYKELKNVQGVYRTKASRFGHADFVWSINIKSLVNQKLLRIIRQFEEGYLLWNNGFDVWLGNVRGNRYSKNHTTLSIKNETFWDFSLHEMGVYDLPAVIDYILLTTGFTQLHYIGHSQGTAMFFVMCTKKPSYNEKIILMQAMAPAVYLSHLKSPLFSPLMFILNVIMQQYKGEVFASQFLKQTPCFIGKVVTSLCIELLYLFFGHTDQFNITLAPMLLSVHAPAGASIKAFRHFFQFKNSGEFSEYDYGPTENLKRYRSDKPPKYKLSDITAPVVIHYGANDYLIDPIDVHRLYKELKNAQGLYRVKVNKFGHVDFTWSVNVRSLVNQKLLKIIRQFEEGTLVLVVE